ncbi:MAG TPA: VanZ family protein [Flavisolibacter sp.]|nr:VanZ family protein [Flavisolibacter sp.]
MLQWKLFRSKWLAITWFLVINILFFLPGSSLPDGDFFDLTFFDKWVHAGFFAALFFLWRAAFEWNMNKPDLTLFSCLFIYAVAVEVIQHYFVVNRSFDLLDIVADTAGSLIGLLVWRWGYKKK